MSAEPQSPALQDLRARATPALLARAVGPPRPREAQRAWDLLIAGYLYLGGLGAGAFIVATSLGWLGVGVGPSPASPVGAWEWDWAQLFVLWGPFATALGATLLIFHLGRNRWRFWSAGFNPRTSWMARGFWILLAFIALGAAVAAVSVLLPDWPGRAPAAWRVLQAVAVATAFGTAVYTGLLLRSMRYIPAWRSSVLPWLFLASALSTGSMGVVLGLLAYGALAGASEQALEPVRGIDAAEPLVLVAEAALLAAFVVGLRRGSPAGRLSAGLWLGGSWRLGFWGGIVGLALALPFALVLAGRALESPAVTVVAALSVLTGGFLLRCGVLAIGITEAAPLYRLACRRAEGPATEGRAAAEAGR